MKTILLKLGMVLVLLNTAAITSLAQMQTETSDAWWDRLGISYRAAFNISANFTGLGGFTSMNTPGVPGPTPTTGGPGTVMRTYDDGFIGVDISGNAGGTTTYWGYNNSSGQVAGGNVLMHSSSSPATASSSDAGSDPQNGMELSYFHPLGGKGRCHWGVEGALSWTPIKIEDDRSLAGDVVTLTHAYALNGVVPPPAPPAYVGLVSGPGAPQLGTDAADAGTTTQTGAATVTGNRKIEANLFGLRIGPYVEYDLSKRVSVDLGGGFAAGVIDSKFEYTNMVTIPGLGSSNSSGSDHSSRFLYGGYVRGQFNVNVYKSASVFAGAELNSLNDFTQSSGAAHAQLNLGTAVYVTAGIGFSF
jgi:hypothetical protein